MAGITGQGTTFNLPNYHGRLFSVSPSDTPFLSAIGGLSGGEAAAAIDFNWSTYDLRSPAARPRLEGANAPTAEARVRAEVWNTTQIIHETVEVSYTKQAAVGQFEGKNIPGANAVQDELGWQLEQALKQIAMDTEVSFLSGTFARPADNATARRTRGLNPAITTNVSTNGGTPRDLTEDIVLDLMQDIWESGGIREDETRTIITNASLKRALTKIFITDKGYAEGTRNVGGVNLQTFETDFGRCNIMLNRWQDVETLTVCSLEACKPRLLFIPGKGFLFAEPLAKTGSAEKVQIYGEIGLEYGHEALHGKADDLQAAA